MRILSAIGQLLHGSVMFMAVLTALHFVSGPLFSHPVLHQWCAVMGVVCGAAMGFMLHPATHCRSKAHFASCAVGLAACGVMVASMSHHMSATSHFGTMFAVTAATALLLWGVSFLAARQKRQTSANHKMLLGMLATRCAEHNMGKAETETLLTFASGHSTRQLAHLLHDLEVLHINKNGTAFAAYVRDLLGKHR